MPSAWSVFVGILRKLETAPTLPVLYMRLDLIRKFHRTAVVAVLTAKNRNRDRQPKGMAKKSEINALKTREQQFRETKWDRMFVSKKLITSEAFRSLRTATACQVYMIFRSKCRMEKVQARPMSRDKEWHITNNGEIQFSYIEAKGEWGISGGKFTRAIDDLVRVGLIDIAKTGFGLQRDVNLYAISYRWEKFGTDEFVVQKRPKRMQNIGFAKGNSYGRNSGKKQSQHSSVTVEQQL